MQIGFVCYEMFHPGGIRAYGHELLNRFAIMGHDVVLFTSRARQEATYLDRRVEVVSIPISQVPLTSVFSFWIQLPSAFRRATRDRKFDVVHSNCTDDAFLSRGAAMEIPRVVTIHHLGVSVLRTANRSHFSIFRAATKEYGPAVVAEGMSIQRADRIIAVSGFTRTEILRHYPQIDPGRVTTIYNGIRAPFPDPDFQKQADLRHRFGLKPGTRVILFVGRLEERKGLRFLFDALSRLPKPLDAKLVLVGSGNAIVYRKLARRLGIEDQVEFAGYLNEPDLLTAYSIADMLVQPSIVEGFGFAAADAVQRGIPVVATRVGAVPEIIRDGVDGSLVDYGDHVALARAITKNLDFGFRKPEREPNSFSSRFDWDKAASETLKVYEKAQLAG